MTQVLRSDEDNVMTLTKPPERSSNSLWHRTYPSTLSGTSPWDQLPNAKNVTYRLCRPTATNPESRT
jgi:hypothetical protein